jgi:hypothetical protein
MEHTHEAVYEVQPEWDGITKRLNKQARWASGIETQLARLNEALTAVRATPPLDTTELATRLTELVGKLAAARQQEMNARRIAKDAEESYKLAIAFALGSAPLDPDRKGKDGAPHYTVIEDSNDKGRDRREKEYLAAHGEVQAAKAGLAAAQAALEQAQVDLKIIEDEFTSAQAAARLMAAQLTYLSGR